MDLNQCLKTFTYVVEQKSFAQAARLRYCSAPQVSKEINWLESEVGAQLLTRTTRKLSLTESGERIYHYAKKVLGVCRT